MSRTFFVLSGFITSIVFGGIGLFIYPFILEFVCNLSSINFKTPSDLLEHRLLTSASFAGFGLCIVLGIYLNHWLKGGSRYKSHFLILLLAGLLGAGLRLQYLKQLFTFLDKNSQGLGIKASYYIMDIPLPSLGVTAMVTVLIASVLLMMLSKNLKEK